MHIIDLAESAIADANAQGRLAAAKAYAKTLYPLRQMLQGTDRDDVFWLLDSGFNNDFDAYLCGPYAATQRTGAISEATVAKHIANLRLLTRQAITRLGALPNIRPDADQPEVKTYNGGVRKQLGAIAQAYSQLAEEGDSPYTRLMRRTLCLLLLGVMCCGIGAEALCMLPREAYSGTQLCLPRLGSIQLPAVVRTLLDSVAASTDSRYLVRYLSGDDTDDAIANKLAGLSLNIRQALASLHIDDLRLLEFPFASWLSIALEDGCPVPVVRSAIDVYLGKESGMQPVQRVTDNVAAECAGIARSWYAVKCLSLSGEKLAARIADDYKLPSADIYVPRNVVVREVKGRKTEVNNPVIDRLMFVRRTARDIEALQREIRTLGIVYSHIDDGGMRRYTVVPDRQLENFRLFLGVPEASLIALDAEQHYQGAPVRVKSGPFAGCEGIIDTVKLSRSGATTYVKAFIVKIEGVSVLGTLDVAPGLVEYL